MNAFKGTPGPWYAGEQSEISGWVDISIPGYSRNSVAFATPATSGDAEARRDPETLANARLIAAAPELLESLEDLVLMYGHRGGVDPTSDALLPADQQPEEVRNAMAAIAKAVGP